MTGPHPSRRAGWAPRALVGAILLLALGGPSPGHIGNCDGDAQPADPADYCARYRAFFCAREYQGGRINAADYTLCAERSAMFCMGFNFDPMCGVPTQRRANLCIDAMSDMGRVATPTTNLPECQFCGGV